MMLKFKSRQPKPLFQQQDLIGTSSSSSTSNKCPSDSSSSSSSSQPHSPSTPNSPSLGSYSPIASDSPTLKAGFDMISVDSTSRQPKAGILLYTKPPASAGAAVMNAIEDDENECIQQLERPGSNSSLPSLRFSESGGGQQQQQSQRNSKHIAYATAFEGSIVRRREITTPSSTDSRQGSPQPSRPTMEKQSSSSSLPNQPQFEYSRIYYSSNNSQKKRKGGLKGILAL